MADPTIVPSVDEPSATKIELRLPADLTRSHVARSLAASIAIAEDYDLDAVADVRLAVDEACATVIPLAVLDSVMTCTFVVSEAAIEFSAQVECAIRPQINTGESFGWQVLLVLADEARVEVVDPPRPGAPYGCCVHVRLSSGRR